MSLEPPGSTPARGSLWDRRAPLGETAEMPEWISPMLASSGPPFSDPDWAYEMKWDGYRGLAFVRRGQLRLLSRQGNSLLRLFPELSVLAQAMRGRDFVLDGEIVCLDAEGVAQFQRLQARSQAGQSAQVQRFGQQDPATYYAFDLLYLDGRDLRPLPWWQRRELLQEGLLPHGCVRFSEAILEQGEAFFDLVQARGLEGIVAKRLNSPYRSGRSSDWIKIKTWDEIDCVIAGQTPSESGRPHFGSLVLGLYREGRLLPVGHVGSGFSQEELQRVARELEPLKTGVSPFASPADPGAQWLRPEKVCRVRYQSRTETGHLRAPVYRGLVEGGEPLQCLWDPEATPVDSPLLPPSSPEQVVLEANGRHLKLTHLHKVLFPRDGITKGNLLRYYDEIAEGILPHLRDRPLSLKRYPDGIEADFFFQKRTYTHFPAWLPSFSLENSRGETVETPLCNDRASLLFLVNLGCIDHNPWLSRIQSLDQPDFMMLDLDPADCTFARVVEAALAVKALLEELGLRSYPKTSGSRGLHIYVPVAEGYEFVVTRNLAHLMARLLGERHPNLFTLQRAGTRRAQDRVYLDAPQNRRGATTASAYSVRAVAGAPVSTPLSWDEVGPELDFREFTLKTIPERFRKLGDLLAEALRDKQRLESAVVKLERRLSPE